MYQKKEIDYRKIELELKKLRCRIVLITLPADKKIIQNRINDRLRLYPHYKKILHQPDWYIKQQKEYLKEIKKTSLPYLIVETNKLPDDTLTNKIINWINDKKNK